jgi:hypothetical protein
MVEKLGLELNDRIQSDHRVAIYFTPSFPVWLILEIEPLEENAFLYIHGRAHGIVGDKSDYYDLLSSIFAICFRQSDSSSAYTIKEGHVVSGLKHEIYAFTTLFHKQPPLTFINLSQPDYKAVETVVVESYWAARIVSAVWGASGEDMGDEQYDSSENVSWISAVIRKMRIKRDSRNLNLRFAHFYQGFKNL